jgi:kynureninase
VIYLDGNSLGADGEISPRADGAGDAGRMGRDADPRLEQGGLDGAACRAGRPDRQADRGGPGTVVLGDTLSIKVYQALASALEMNPKRRVILSDTGNFPSDLYMAEGSVPHPGRPVPAEDGRARRGDVRHRRDSRRDMITEVDYRTGRRHDMADITRRAHEMGALTVWDLAHSAGAVPVDLTADQGRLRRGLHLQIPQLRPRRPGLHLCRPETCRHRPPCPLGLAGP